MQYAHIVKDQALRRRLAGVGREIQELASQETGELEVLLDEAERKVFLLAEKKREGDLRPVSELMEQTLDLLDKMKTANTGVTGLSTGYIDLDKQLTGLHAGELIILAARPGIGKTSFAMNIAMHAALKENKAVGIFSLEMPADQLLMRLLASRRARGHEEAARRPALAARRGEVPGDRGRALQRAHLHRRLRRAVPVRPARQGPAR